MICNTLYKHLSTYLICVTSMSMQNQVFKIFGFLPFSCWESLLEDQSHVLCYFSALEFMWTSGLQNLAISQLCIKSRTWVWDYLKSKCLRNKWKIWRYQRPPSKTFNSSAVAVRPQSLQTQFHYSEPLFPHFITHFSPVFLHSTEDFLLSSNFRLYFRTFPVNCVTWFPKVTSNKNP